MLIDSHHHLWKYSADQYGWINDDMPALRHDFWADELSQIAGQHSVDGFVTVQARQSLAETESLLTLSETQSLIKGVVGWIDFASDDAAEQLERFATHPRLKGLRHVVQDEPDDQFILGDRFNRGIRLLAGQDLVYDILIYARQLAPAIQFARAHPEIPMILDHIAKPTIRNGAFDPQWANEIRQLAALPNTACKFSGVATEVAADSWDVELIRPYWDVVLESFTPSRLMFGSDWPVCLLKTDYGRWLNAVTNLAGDLSPAEQNEFFAETAKRLYHLE
ncbi:amidohydrolase family protein [Stieleria sp. TO1_6]|uniref:amidohydrolase family protein n=1 Tax=Stieleria tagensis TaxID=2956795 RepID=UPI00209AF538|nr:amidohydrolase family protein [Stieleria tagensis]MCO8123920.1 amidohydrolase family protein [Stieleria tagensis]